MAMEAARHPGKCAGSSWLTTETAPVPWQWLPERILGMGWHKEQGPALEHGPRLLAQVLGGHAVETGSIQAGPAHHTKGTDAGLGTDHAPLLSHPDI